MWVNGFDDEGNHVELGNFDKPPAAVLLQPVWRLARVAGGPRKAGSIKSTNRRELLRKRRNLGRARKLPDLVRAVGQHRMALFVIGAHQRAKRHVHLAWRHGRVQSHGLHGLERRHTGGPTHARVVVVVLAVVAERRPKGSSAMMCHWLPWI